MAAQKKTSKKVQEISKSLLSKDTTIVLRAIKSAKVHGNDQILRVILGLLNTHEDAKVQDAVRSFLLDLKSSSALPILIEAIQGDKFKDHKALLISVFWNSPLNPNEHVSLLVNEAIQGDFEVALECYTAIDNVEPPIEEEQVNDALLMLKEYFAQNPSEDKIELIKDIARVIKEMEQSI